METRTVTVSDKGQIAIPVEMRNSIGISRGDTLVLVQDGERILVEKSKTVAKGVAKDFAKLKQELASWDNLSDEALDNFEAQL